MSLWRVRIIMPADPASHEWLAAALAGQRVLALPSPDSADPAGEVIIDLPSDDSLGTLLSDLHTISPQVFISSVDEPTQLPVVTPPAVTSPVGEQAGDEGMSEPALVAAGRPTAHRNQAAI